MEELSHAYDLSINTKEIKYLFDLPEGTLAPNKIIDSIRLQIEPNKSTTK